MVMLETNFKTLQKLIGKKLNIEEFEEALFNLGMELDEQKGDEIKIEVTAERPDMVSPQGLARALRAYFGLKNPKYTAKEPLKNYKVIIDKSVSKVRPFTACAIVKNLKFTDDNIKEIIWVQEKLHATFGRNRKKAAIGIYPLEKIKLPIYYRAANPNHIKFRPLESGSEMTANEIINEHKTGKEFAHLLEGSDVYPYFCDGAGSILSMPPIINSHDTGRVTTKTKELFIECSGHDFASLSQTLNILVYLFQDMGGVVYQMDLQYPDKKIISPEINPDIRKISSKYVSEILGKEFTSKEIANNLKKAMHEIKKITKENVEFSVPPIRTDIWHDIDVVDDVLRVFGVNNIVPELPEVSTEGKLLYENRLKKIITELMIGLSFQEIFTLTLTNSKDQYEKMNYEEIPEHIMLSSSVEENIGMLRTWLLPEAIKALMNNRNREYPQKIFEINYITIPEEKSDVLSKDKMHFCSLIAAKDADFTKAKQVIINILESLGYDAKFKATNHNSFIQGRTASIFVKGKNIGTIGEIHPQVLENFGIEVPVSGFEIDLELLR